MGVQVADTLAWLSDELRSECSQPVLQRARGIANQWRSKMEDLHCLNDTASNRITLYATIRGTTSPSSRYEVQATLDFADELFLARYCSCPAFSGSQRGYGSYRTFDYHNSPKYRSFDDDDDYDYVDDYDDFGSGSTYGHVNDDDDSASSTSRRYTGMCKHVAAMLLLFLQQPERFRGFHAAAATPRALADYMRSLDAKSNNAGENAQLDVLKRIINAKSRLIEEQRGASGQGAAKPKRKSSAPVDVKPGSVYLEPTLINGHDALRLSLRIGCGDADYALKNISRFVADMRTGTYESYGKKLAFTHTPDMLDPFSLKLYRFLQQVIASRTAAQLQNGYYYGEAVRVDRELVLTDWEACDLLDLFHAVFSGETDTPESREDLETMAAALKASSTWTALSTLQECREACGGAGFIAENRLTGLRADLDVYVTFEGDNTVLLQLVGKRLLSDYANEFKNIDAGGMARLVVERAADTVLYGTPVARALQTITDQGQRRRAVGHLRGEDAQRALLADRVETMVEHVAGRLRPASKLPAAEAAALFNQNQHELIEMAKAHAELVQWEAFTKALLDVEDEGTRRVLTWVRDLYGLTVIENNLAWYLMNGRLTGQRARTVSSYIDRLVLRLRPHAQDLVDAFGYGPEHLRAPIATGAEKERQDEARAYYRALRAAGDEPVKEKHLQKKR